MNQVLTQEVTAEQRRRNALESFLGLTAINKHPLIELAERAGKGSWDLLEYSQDGFYFDDMTETDRQMYLAHIESTIADLMQCKSWLYLSNSKRLS